MRLKTIALTIITAFSLIGFSAGAQNLKIAYVNSSELMDTLDVMDSIKVELEALSGKYQKRLEYGQKELQDKVAYNQANPAPDQEFEAFRQDELQKMQTRLQQLYQEAQQAVAQKEQQMLSPVIKRVKEVILEVAKAKGYDYVLDSSEGGSVLYGAEKYSLMSEVITAMKKENLMALIK